MKILITALALTFIAHIVYGQSNEQSGENLFLKAKKCYEYTKYDSAIILYNQALKIFDKTKKKEEYFNCLIGIGQCYCKKNEFTRALDHFKDLQIKSETQFGKNTAIPATSIYYQGYASLNLYRFDDAGSQIIEALRLRKNIFGETNPDVAQAYNLHGQYFLYRGEYDKSLKNFEMALKIREKIYGTEHQDVAQSLNNISTVFYYMGKLDTAIYLAEKSLKLKEKVLEANHPDFILSYNSLAVYLNDKFEYSQALEMHLKNLSLCEKYYGNSNSITATVYYNIGLTYYKLNDYKSAIDNLDKAYQIRKSLTGKNSPDLAAVLLAKGDVYDKTFEYDKAIEEKQKALDLFLSAYNETHQNTATAYNSLGVSFLNNGDFSMALQNFQKAFGIFNKMDGETNNNSAMCLVNIGNAYWQKGQSELSIKYFMQAISVYRELYGDFSYELAIVYSNIGEVYNGTGEYNKALGYFEKSGEIYTRIFDAYSEPLAIIYKNKGNSYEYMGNTDEALKNYQIALDICLKTNGEKNLNTAVMFENIGKVKIEKGDFKQARFNFEKVFEIRRSLLPRKHYLLANSLIDLGLTDYRAGFFNDALMNFSYSLECNLNDYTPAGINTKRIPEIKNYQDIIGILNALKGKAIVFAALYDEDKKASRKNKSNLEDALEHIKACDQTIDIIRKSYLDEKDKLDFSESSTQVYDFAINLCNLLYIESKDQKYTELAFYYSEKLKAVALFEALSGTEAEKFGNIPDSVIRLEKQLDIKLANIRKQIAEFDDYRLQDTLFKLENKKQELIKYCESKYPKYFELKYANNTADVKAIQASLDNNTALVSYYQNNLFVYQIVLTNSDIKLSINNKSENFDQNLASLRNSIINGSVKENTIRYKELAWKFYELLFPVKMDNQITKLIIVPAGNLASIPFEVLLTSKVAAGQKFKDLPYLINRYTISYAYSANLYFLTSKKIEQNKVEFTQLNDWLAFAPVFSDESTSGLSIRSRSLLEQINQSFDTLQTRGTLLNGNYVSPLPGTENEVKSIFDEFNDKNKKAVIKLHQSASESFVKSDELKNYRFIHFATHGFVDSENPELSGILMAQDTSGGNDGILFSGEIYNLEVNADLVTLSACETGLGKVQSGEGIIGLTRALLYAGARNIIVSLWQVSDEATSKLMIDFYGELLKSDNQNSFAGYLRNSKLRMIKEGKFSHPFFWSPFVLVGR